MALLLIGHSIRPLIEALLHQFLGRTTAASVAGRATALLANADAAEDSSAAASAAALRRASELLSICSEARRRGGSGIATSKGVAAAMQDGTLALCRKQYFAGESGGKCTAGRYSVGEGGKQ